VDFRWSEEQQELRTLARSILDDLATHDRLSALEADGDTVFDRDLWRELANAGILGVVIPEAQGGAGLGLLELLLVLEEAGRTVAPVPLVPTLVSGALTLTEFGDDDIAATWLPRIAAGDAIVTAALEGVDDGLVEVAPDGSLAGECWFVPYAAEADLLLVPATRDDHVGLYLVAPGAGVSVTALRSTNRAPLGHVVLDGASAVPLVPAGPDGDRAVDWVVQRTMAAWCAVQAGVCEGALQHLAAHTSTREQFGKKIAEFQAVSQRAADAFIDTQMVRLTAWQAVFRLSQGWACDAEVLSARFWAGDGAMRVVHAAQHLHGGIGVDLSYPLHRYFLWAKQLEHTVGTPTRSLVRLGRLLADQPA
jgi:3-oxocholest-4-en-26-oyl-CoA dehydrogenase beta subunit